MVLVTHLVGRNIFKSLTVIGAEFLGYDFLISFQFSVSEYTNAFAFTQLCGVLCAPWNGVLMDRHKRKPLSPGQLTEKSEDLTSNNTRLHEIHFSFPHLFAGVSEREADLRSSVLSLLLTSLQCLLFSISASIPFLPLQYVTFILQVLNRSFLYGGNAAFISIA